ncbi:with coiled-coil, ANK repeat and PH domain-containing protein [Seminavis robusta]|uniref:With coiled-coil, ANK repeat and PH domain-containing protein n=1 Tax=Seminavis robusta TaxID=568900 RepID=A0A9N8D789_9STRA|nr:with coiled-coil, ANK repeat and PH domain-containing protein [Seminavis robusta]|eukprot:Sro24_g016470.1 with coiled-coil, ANK repeat and PH domain-containing protein (558) ;mRNA; f:102943-105037
MKPPTPRESRRVSTFSDSNLTTLESLVLEVALEDAKQHQQASTARSSSDPIKECEMDTEDYERIQRLLGNHCCADCESTDTEWASVSFGLLLCADCSGIHRALGTHISRVRSVKMDFWSEEHLELMRHGGNYAFQKFVEKQTKNDASFDFYETPIDQKYTSDAAVAYKSVLKKRAQAAAKGTKPGLDETESSTETAASSTVAENNKESKQYKFKKQQQQLSPAGMDDSANSFFADDTSTDAATNNSKKRNTRQHRSMDDNSDHKASIQEEEGEDDDQNDSDSEAARKQKEEEDKRNMSLDSWFNKKPTAKRRMKKLPVPSSDASCSGKSTATTNTIQSAIASITSRRSVRRSNSSASAPTITYMGRSFSAADKDGTVTLKHHREADRLKGQSDVRLLADMADAQEKIARENLGTSWRQDAWRQSAPAQMQWSADRRIAPFSFHDDDIARRVKTPARHESLRKKLAYTDADLLQIALDDKEFARLKAGLKTKGAVTNGILEQKLYAFVAKSKLRKNTVDADEESQVSDSNQPRSHGRQRMQASKSENLSMMRRTSTFH